MNNGITTVVLSKKIKPNINIDKFLQEYQQDTAKLVFNINGNQEKKTPNAKPYTHLKCLIAE